MRNLKDILEKDLGRKWSLTEEEKSSLWESVSKSLPEAAPQKRGGFLYWAAAAVAAAVVAGVFLLKSPSSDPTPFQPENTPIEKTTTLADGSGAATKEETHQEKDIQNPVLALAANPAEGRQGLSEEKAESVVKGSEENFSEGNHPVQNTVLPESTQTSEENAPAPQTVIADQDNTQHSQGNTQHSQGNIQGAQNKSRSSFTRNYTGDYSAKSAYRKRFALSASSNFSGRGKMDGSANPMVKAFAEEIGYTMYSNAPVIENVSEVSYSLPLNFTVGVTYKINNYLSIGSGLSYSYLHSKYNGSVNMVNYSIKQDVHYVGIPLNLYVNLGSTGNLDFYAATGGTIEKGVKANYQMKSFKGTRSSSDSHVKGVQFSVKAAAGMEYRFGKSKNVGIYLEPSMVYYFDSNLPGSIRTDQPLQVEAQAGVRFHLK